MTPASHAKMNQEFPDFRSYLQAELVRRCKANPRYSMRSFASFLGIGSSDLSKILSGRRRVSGGTFRRLAKKLALSPTDYTRFEPGILRRSGRLPGDTTASQGGPAHYAQLSLDLFQVIADWYHYAILELTRVEHFKSEPKWVARSLGISVSEVNLAVERLLRLEMLKVDDQGRWVDISGATTNIKNDFTDAALRSLQKEILIGAIAALEEVPIERRDQTSMTMAIHSSLLPEARERVKKFRRELCAFLKSKKPFDQVYQMSVSLYPATRISPDSERDER